MVPYVLRQRPKGEYKLQAVTGPLNGVKFDGIYTAENIGSYKPDLNNFRYLVENVDSSLGLRKTRFYI